MTQKNFKGIKEELNFWIKENFKSKKDDTMIPQWPSEVGLTI